MQRMHFANSTKFTPKMTHNPKLEFFFGSSDNIIREIILASWNILDSADILKALAVEILSTVHLTDF